MTHSLSQFVTLIEKYKDKIDFIFCNAEEYKILKNILFNKTKIIVTNEGKPILYIEKDKVTSYSIPPVDFKILSMTGAGDSFIGGFLSAWLQTRSILSSIINGVAGANLCLQNYGNDKIKKNDLEKEKKR